MTEKVNLYKNVSVKRNDNSEVTITAEIPTAALARYHLRALKKLQGSISLPGFRAGHVPEKMLVDRLGEAAILEETARLALADAFSALVLQEKLPIIGHPHVTIIKLAPGNPVVFKAEAALMPEVTLPDYMAIAREILTQKEEPVEVTDTDIAQVMRDLRVNKWRIDNRERAERGEPPTDDELPELTDEMIRTIGNFQGVSDFKVRLKADLTEERKRKRREKRRIEVGEKLIEKSTISLPRFLIDSELGGMLAQLKHDVERAGVSFNDYLANVKKTEEEIRAEWRPAAEKRAKLQLVLRAIAEQEKIEPDKETVEREIEHILSHHGHARPKGGDADPTRARAYIETILGNEAVFQFLENQK